jgi:hypothetical protein
VGAREGPPTGLCVVRVTRLTQEEILITVTTTLDVGHAVGRSSNRVTGTDDALDLIRKFLEEWQQKW